jgi:hypothetical protein
MCKYYQVIQSVCKDATKNVAGKYLNDGFCCTYPGLSESSSTINHVFAGKISEKIGDRIVI